MSKFFKVKKATIEKKANNISYYVKAYWGEINKDNYEEGEYEKVRSFFDDVKVNDNYATPLDAANAIIEAYGFNAITDKSYWGIERDEKGLKFETSVTADKNQNGDFIEIDTNSERYKQFENGEIDLYSFTFVILIGKRQEVDFDDSEI